MIDTAEKRENQQNTVIVEATSGNTGIGLAMVCAARGYKLAITMPESMSKERKMLLRTFGAELILTPPPKVWRARLPKRNPWWTLIQTLILCRASSTMRQIPKSTAKQPPRKFGTIPTVKSMSSLSVGTGSTITGVGEVLKKYKPEVKVVAVEPEASPY